GGGGGVKEGARRVGGGGRRAVAPLMRVDGGAWAGPGGAARADGGHPARPRHEIRMDVRFDRGDNRRARLPCGLDVNRSVAPRVDDGCLFRPIAADEKRGLRQAFFIESLEHTIRFFDAHPGSYTGMHLLTVAGVIGAGAVAGCLGSLLGLGGGVFLVPFLNAGLGLDFKVSAATGLMTVIATSSVVSAGRAGRNLINLRLGMLLEVATTVGGLIAAL